MKIELPTPLVLALRAEYPGCLADRGAVEDFITSAMWQWLTMNRRARHQIAESLPLPADQLAPEPAATAA